MIVFYTNDEIENVSKSLNAETYRKIVSKIDSSESAPKILKESARNYLLLTYSNLFDDSLKVFYSRYYWFLVYSKNYQIVYGINEGLKQQLFQIIESSESISESIDWNIIEEMENKIKTP